MTDILVADFIKGFLIFLRIVAIVFTAPVLNNRNIPRLPKIIFSIFLTYITFFIVPDFDYDYYRDGLIMLGLIGFKEMITGILMGFMLTFVFYILSYAGMLIGFDMGLSAAMGFDPSSESNTNIIGQLFTLIGTIVFILINGHHYAVEGLGYSFKIIPIGYYTINGGVVIKIIEYSAAIFILSVKIASPILVSFFLLHIASGIIARVSPQMNVFFVIQPLQMGLGFLLLVSVTPIYIFFFKELLQSYEAKLFELVKLMGG